MKLQLVICLSWLVLTLASLPDRSLQADTRYDGAAEAPNGALGDGWHRKQQRQLLDASLPDAAAAVLTTYLNSTEMEAHMRGFVKRCSHMARMFSIGTSVHGRDLWALELSEKPGLAEAKPNAKYVANMHGDEPSGRQLLLGLAEWLCANHNADERAARIVRDMHLFLLPTMNPDGFEAHQRGNARKVDLNRDFPDPIKRGVAGVVEPSGSEQPETLALMRWIRHGRFTVSASMHEGALVANYPWDGSEDRGTHYEACPDDAAYVHLARVYAGAHAKMAAPGSEFPQGITNGAAWYPLWGGMQDWNYLAGDCMELTLELSQHKWPAPELLPQLFADNLPAMLAYPVAGAFGGARGFVRERPASQNRHMLAASSAAKGRPLGATITVNGINKTVSASSTFGDFYRPLAPGVYNITAAMPGFAAETVTVEVPEGGEGVFLEFFLASDGGLAQWGLGGRKFGPFGLLGGDAEEGEASEGGGQGVLGKSGNGGRLMQNAVFILLGLGVLLLLRSAHQSLYRQRPAPQGAGPGGGSGLSPARRTPPR